MSIQNKVKELTQRLDHMVPDNTPVKKPAK